MAADPTSLKFDIILNDKDFKTQINADIDLARRLNEQVSKSLNMGHLTQTSTQAAVATEKVTKATNDVTKAQKGAQVAIEKSAKSLSSGGGLTRAWLRFSATMWSVISAVRLFTRTIGAAIKNIADFQQANANLATIMQVSRREIEVLTNDALMLGRTTEWTASQVTQLQTALAKLGYDIPQIRNMQASVLQFATAVGAKLPEAANLAGASLRMFGLRSSETKKALEILTASTNKSALDFEKLKVSLPYVGAIAHSIGFDLAQTASMLGVLTNAGLESSRAGTGLRQVLLELSKTNGKLQTAMGGNIKTFDDFVNGLQKMRDRGLQAGEATKLVSTRASSALLILANGVDTIKKLNDEVRDTDGLLKTIQADRLDTLHGSTLLLKSAWEGLIQTFRDSAGPMKEIVDWLTKIVRETSLLAGRANRIAQGTDQVLGSDELTNQFKEMYENLLSGGMTPEEAQKQVKEKMQTYMDSFYLALNSMRKQGYRETPWTRFLWWSPFSSLFAREGTMGRGRAANEQVEAMENTMDAVGDYMANRAKEDGEIAAQNFLSKWRMIFDAQGEAAAREAMSKVSGYEAIKAEVEEYIKNGGAAGANNRGKGKTRKEQLQELISGLKAEATYLRRIYDDYMKLVPLLGEEGAGKKMSEIFGGEGYSKENIEQGIIDITDALKGMEAEGKEAAEEILRSWGLDNFSRAYKQLQNEKKAAEDAQKSLNKYLETLQEWADKNNVNQFDGAIKKYYKALSDADEIAKKATSSLLGGNTDEGQRLTGFAHINAEWAADRANALATLKKDLDEYAESYLKEELERKGFDLTDWADKNIAQINAIRDAIQEIEVSDTLKENLLGQEGGEQLLAMLNEALEKIKQAKIDKTVDPERWKKIAKQAKYIAERFLSVSESLKEFADASGNTTLSDAASRIGALAQNIKAAEEGYKVFGEWWGAVIGGGADLIEQVLAGLTATEREAKELRDAVRDIRQETEEQSFKDALLDGVDGVFGENFVKRLKNAVGLLDDIRMKVKALEYTKPERNWLGAYNDEDMMDWERWNALRNGTPGTMPFVTSHSWLTGDTTRTLAELAKEFNLEITDKNGLLNPTLLQAIIDKYGELNEGAVDWLTDSIRYAKEYEEALQQIEDATKDIFDNLASDMADKFIDNYLKMGNAVDDLSATFADLGDAILRSFLQSYIIDEILGKYKDEAKNALTKYSTGEMTPEDYANWLEGFASNVQKESEALAPAINGMIEAFKDRGLMNIDEDTANSVGAGIKGITEDTANLLASYINAIRADVSSIRLMQEKWSGSIEVFGAAIPTLNDYMNQIAANTYDTAQNTQSILSELQSVIGSPGTSGMVVRVETY